MLHGRGVKNSTESATGQAPQMELSTQLQECMDSSLMLSLYKHKIMWLIVLLYLTQIVSNEDKVYGTEPELCDYEKGIYCTTEGRERERERGREGGREGENSWKVFCKLGLIPRSQLNCDLEWSLGVSLS